MTRSTCINQEVGIAAILSHASTRYFLPINADAGVILLWMLWNVEYNGAALQCRRRGPL